MKETQEYKIGDRVLYKMLFSSQVFHVKIIAVKKGFFWNTYYGEWTVHYVDEDYRSTKSAKLRTRGIICLN